MLRDSYYRLREAYIGGAIDSITYDNLIRRLNNQTIAYLTVEGLTTAAATAAATDLAPLVTVWEAARGKKDAAADDAKKADDAVKACSATPPTSDCKDATRIEDLKKGQTAKAAALKSSETELGTATKNMTAAAKPSATGGTTSPGKGSVGDSAVKAVENITLAIVNADYAPQMCFALMRSPKDENGLDTEIRNYCEKILDTHQQAYAARTALSLGIQAEEVEAFDSCTAKAKGSAEAIAACRKKVNAPQDDRPRMLDTDRKSVLGGTMNDYMQGY